MKKTLIFYKPEYIDLAIKLRDNYRVHGHEAADIVSVEEHDDIEYAEEMQYDEAVFIEDSDAVTIFTKADEMELAINYKAARNAFVFLEFALAVYCLVCFLKTGELPWVWLIFIVSGLVFYGTKLVETKRLTDPGDSDEE